MAIRVPFLRTVVLTLADTDYNLFELLRALIPDIPVRAQAIQLQFDVDANAKCRGHC